jgi:hypothetical protein
MTVTTPLFGADCKQARRQAARSGNFPKETQAYHFGLSLPHLV